MKKKLILLVLLFCLSFGLTTHYPNLPLMAQDSSASALIEQAQQYYQTGNFEDAATAWQQAADEYGATGDRLNQAMSLSNLSLTYQQLGKWTAAEKAIADSLNLLRTETKTPQQQGVLAASLDIQGQLQLNLGQAEAASETWQQAAKIYTQIKQPQSQIRSQINQAQALQELGLYPRACQNLLNALEIDASDCDISAVELQNLQQRTPTSLQILGLRSLGNVFRAMGKAQQSQQILVASWQLAQKLGDTSNLDAIYLSLGNTAHAIANRLVQLEKFKPDPINLSQATACLPEGDTNNANRSYQQAVSCYRQAETSASLATRLQAQINRLSLLIQLQQPDEIPNLISNIQNNIDRLPASRATINTQLKFAQNLICLQSQTNPTASDFNSPILQACPSTKTPLNIPSTPSWQSIRQFVTAILNRARSLEDRQAQANALGYLAAIEQQTGNISQAQTLTEQALRILSTSDNPEIAYLWQWQLGRLYQQHNEPTKALQAYNLAFDSLKSLRGDLIATNPDVQYTFRDSVEPVYRELVDLLLASDNPSQESLKQARNVVEALQIAELNNFFREACLKSKPQSVEQLDTQAAVIYSIVLPKRIAVILSIPQQSLRYYIADTGRTEGIEAVFDELFTNLNPFISTPDPLRPHQQFYDWLIRPAETELEKNQIKTLVFVLDGILRGVPMAALHDGRQYLIEKYNIVLTPGLQLLNPRSLSSEKLKTLIGGLAESRQGFPPLPGVKQEIQEITQKVPTAVLLDQNFTQSRLQKEIESSVFPIIHLATHGRFSSEAENTFLLTWDKRINVKDLDQLLQERQRRGQTPIELLILSACQTASGDKRAALGLAGVAVRSGARSTLATLWAVQDQSTADLMTQFYTVLNQSGVTKAEALRQAQLSLLRSPKYDHPFYWAPFVLVGNWL